MLGAKNQLGGEPATQYMDASISSTQIPTLNQASGVSKYQNSILQQYKDEKDLILPLHNILHKFNLKICQKEV